MDDAALLADAFADRIFNAVDGYVARELGPIRTELAAVKAENQLLADLLRSMQPANVGELVQRTVATALPALVETSVAKAFEALPKPKDGESVTLEQVRPMLVEMVAEIPPAAPGKSVDMAEVKGLVDAAVEARTEGLPQLVESSVAKAVDAQPKPKDGESVTLEQVRPMLAAMVAEIPPAAPGKSVDMAEVKGLVDAAVEARTEGLPQLVETSVAKAVEAQPKPKDGESVTLEQVRPMLAEMVAEIPPAAPGKSVDMAEVKGLVDAAVEAATGTLPELVDASVAKAVEALPPATPGKDCDMDAVLAKVEDLVGAIPPAEPGKSVEPAEVQGMVDAAVEARTEALPQLVETSVAKAVEALPKPKDGESVTLEQVRPMLAELVAQIPPAEPGKSVEPAEVKALVDATVEARTDGLPAAIETAVRTAFGALPAPKDGVGIAKLLIDHKGDLIVTTTDGAAQEVGPVKGRDVDMGAVERQVGELFAAWPKPKDGAAGFGLDDFDVEQKDDGRTVILKFARGDTVETYELCFPVPLDRGVWREGAYKQGDGVTFGNGWWIAQRDTDGKPMEGDDWRLAAKNGRPAKSAYDIARSRGYTGTETEWVEALVGRLPPRPPIHVGKPT